MNDCNHALEFRQVLYSEIPKNDLIKDIVT